MQQMELARAKFLLHSWRDIFFNYDHLTSDEREHCDRPTFWKLVCFSWCVVQEAQPGWFTAAGFTVEHVKKVEVRRVVQ